MSFPPPSWPIELETKPDFAASMQRIEAWYHQQIIDRAPVRFTRHNAEYELLDQEWRPAWRGQKDRWFDVQYQMERFLTQVQGKRFQGETFPIYWPNLGPNVLAAMYGCPLVFGEVTSWAEPILKEYGQPLALDWNSEYLLKLDELTRAALELCPGKFLVGYTDLHPGIDWLAALRDSQRLCMDLFDCPERVKEKVEIVTADFLRIYDHFDAMLKEQQQPSVTWMAIPSFGRMHIPSCDFATMISPRQFEEFVIPALLAEVGSMTHNVFHVDGKGVARHLDLILQLPNLQAIQWVQGVGDDEPILQWVPFIQRVQAAGKSVVVDLTRAELEPFLDAVRPEGILLCLASEDEEDERAVLKRLLKWK